LIININYDTLDNAFKVSQVSQGDATFPPSQDPIPNPSRHDMRHDANLVLLRICFMYIEATLNFVF
jgi:hypothetical protein